MEELTDITSNSISGKDKIIASRAVDALKDFAVEYLRFKKQGEPAWFEIGDGDPRQPRLRRDGSGVAARSRRAADVGRVEGDAPVPRHLQRGARRRCATSTT